jgi:hypothetical protein
VRNAEVGDSQQRRNIWSEHRRGITRDQVQLESRVVVHRTLANIHHLRRTLKAAAGAAVAQRLWDGGLPLVDAVTER